MPNCFWATYGTKVVAIVDCYKIKVETPSHMVAKAATWSQYKHVNSAKVLLQCVPQGVTTFISKTGSRVCMTGLGEIFSHVGAILFYLESANRTRITCTQLECV